MVAAATIYTEMETGADGRRGSGAAAASSGSGSGSGSGSEAVNGSGDDL
jgi:hypothetical protein